MTTEPEAFAAWWREQLRRHPGDARAGAVSADAFHAGYDAGRAHEAKAHAETRRGLEALETANSTERARRKDAEAELTKLRAEAAGRQRVTREQVAAAIAKPIWAGDWSLDSANAIPAEERANTYRAADAVLALLDASAVATAPETVTFPAIPTDADDEKVVDEMFAKATAERKARPMQCSEHWAVRPLSCTPTPRPETAHLPGDPDRNGPLAKIEERLAALEAAVRNR